MNNKIKLDKISSESFNNDSLNLSYFDRDVVESVLSLDIIEDVDLSVDTLNKYRYFDNFFILKVENEYYFVNTAYIDIYYSNSSPLKINDYNIFQRKDKLKVIEMNIDEIKKN